MSVTVRYPHAKAKVVWPARLDDGLLARFRRIPRAVPRTQQLEARAPDPGGGLPWGVLTAKGDRGGWRFSHAEQIVGDRIGQIDQTAGGLSRKTAQA